MASVQDQWGNTASSEGVQLVEGCVLCCSYSDGEATYYFPEEWGLADPWDFLLCLQDYPAGWLFKYDSDYHPEPGEIKEKPDTSTHIVQWLKPLNYKYPGPDWSYVTTNKPFESPEWQYLLNSYRHYRWFSDVVSPFRLVGVNCESDRYTDYSIFSAECKPNLPWLTADLATYRIISFNTTETGCEFECQYKSNKDDSISQDSYIATFCDLPKDNWGNTATCYSGVFFQEGFNGHTIGYVSFDEVHFSVPRGWKIEDTDDFLAVVVSCYSNSEFIGCIRDGDNWVYIITNKPFESKEWKAIYQKYKQEYLSA